MAIDDLMSDAAILEEIGNRLCSRRLALELTQAELAAEAGVAKRTVERIEAGESTQTGNMVRVLRVLGLLGPLSAALPEGGPRPMDLLKLRGKERRRASSKKRRKQTAEEWSWGERT